MMATEKTPRKHMALTFLRSPPWMSTSRESQTEGKMQRQLSIGSTKGGVSRHVAVWGSEVVLAGMCNRYINTGPLIFLQA